MPNDIEIQRKAEELVNKILKLAGKAMMAGTKKERKKAAETLNQIIQDEKHQQTAIDILIESLKSGDANVRTVAALVLGDFKNPKAVGPLREALKDKEGGVQEAATEALKKIQEAGQ